MKIERASLEKEIDRILLNVYKNDKVVDKFCANMFNVHNVAYGTSMDIVGRNADLRILTVKYLLWISKELGLALKEDDATYHLSKNIDINEYFTDEEIGRLSLAKMSTEVEDNFPVVFENVSQVSDDQWVAVADYKSIHRLRDTQIVKYNQNTQRELTLKRNNSVEKLVITIIKKAYKEITEKMLSSKFIPNAITFNINADAIAEFEYDPNNRTLTINRCSLDIIDGFHRYLSMTSAFDQNPELQQNTIVNIMHFSEDKAKAFIVQEDKRNSIKKSKIKSLDTSKNSGVIVHYLNDNSKSHLKDKIGIYGDKMINFTTFSDIIDRNFKIESSEDLLKVKMYIMKAINIIVENNVDLITEKQSDILWMSYFRAISYYYKSNDFDKLEQCIANIDKINFGIVGNKDGKVNKKLYDRVDEILKGENVYV